jgi:predicted metalloenzyme YecM
MVTAKEHSNRSIAKHAMDTGRVQTAGELAAALAEGAPALLGHARRSLHRVLGPAAARLAADHVCWRCAAAGSGEFERMSELLLSEGGARLLSTVLLGGRRVATFRLREPVAAATALGETAGDVHKEHLDLVELADAKPGGRGYGSGWEHVELVLPGALPEEPLSTAQEHARLAAWCDAHPGVAWDLGGAGKAVNADVRLALPESSLPWQAPGGPASVKFHCAPLDVVIAREQAEAAG